MSRGKRKRTLEEIGSTLIAFNQERGQEGIMPKHEEIRARPEYRWLLGAINKFGGFKAIAAQFGLRFEGKARINGSNNKKVEVSLDKLGELIAAFNERRGIKGRMPTFSELRSGEGGNAILMMMRRLGGHVQVAETLGLEPNINIKPAKLDQKIDWVTAHQLAGEIADIIGPITARQHERVASLLQERSGLIFSDHFQVWRKPK